MSGLGFETQAIHAGQPADPTTGAVVTPISLATTFAQAAVGEHSGALGRMLIQAGRFEEAASLKRIEVVGRIAGPVLIMGLFWYLGALAAHLRAKHGWRVPGWWLGALWALFLCLQMTPHFFGLNMIKQLVWGLLCMVGIVWLIDWEQRNEARREHLLPRLLRWTGEISYPLYAVHTPVILLVNWGLLTLASSRSYAWQLSLNLLLPIAVTLVVHHGIERRFYRPRRGG